jgi:2-hydroxy-6-oxonona-2,4-dienedioate hydrolase/4,5:9,10-diseco-3-hydroxy-5,9,17-trioxoandrosta-1(10),2-diene-4-oate hydrolase
MGLTAEGTSRFVQAGGHRLHYHEAGEGPSLLMIHGGGPGAGGWSNYRRNIDALSERFRVVIPDLPGFGRSDKPQIATSLYRYLADSMRDLLDALQIDHAHIVGNSLGGATAVKLALDTPDRVDRLVLMGPGGGLQLFTPRPSEGVKQLFSYYEGGGPTPAKLEKFLDCMVFDRGAITEELFNERLEASLQPGLKESWPFSNVRPPIMETLWKDYDRLKSRTLVIWGRDDRTVPIDNAWAMLNQIPDVRLHVFGKTGHWAQWERAAEFNQLVLGFLNGE